MPVLTVYETEMRQLFQNLITNAIKFTAPDVTPHITIDAEQKNNSYVFRVADNGIGIDPVFNERVFEIFQRLPPADEYKGNGIGLAYCKKIVELHQGEIWIESKPGDGSAFYFTISSFLKWRN